MSNEISINVGLSVDKGGAKDSRFESLSVDMTGDSLVHLVQSIQTTALGEVLDVPAEIATKGYMLLKNLDSTNIIQLGLFNSVLAEFYPFGELNPGEVALYRHYDVGTKVLRVMALVAACNLEIFVIED